MWFVRESMWYYKKSNYSVLKEYNVVVLLPYTWLCIQLIEFIMKSTIYVRIRWTLTIQGVSLRKLRDCVVDWSGPRQAAYIPLTRELSPSVVRKNRVLSN